MTDTTARNEGFKRMLNERRQEMQDDVRRGFRGCLTDRPTEVGDDVEHSDAHIQGDIELALLQMRAETLARIDKALVRLDAGKYGVCVECDREISERRLRALPFAARCQACEAKREREEGSARRIAEQRDGLSLFPNVISF